jgi:hypothetical protein
MSEQATEQTQTEPQGEQAQESKPTTFPVSLVLVPTGRLHNLTGKGLVPIQNEDGSPESEYRLVADVDGEQVTLSSWHSGIIGGKVQAARNQRAAAEQSEG